MKNWQKILKIRYIKEKSAPESVPQWPAVLPLIMRFHARREPRAPGDNMPSIKTNQTTENAMRFRLSFVFFRAFSCFALRNARAHFIVRG